MEGGGCFLSFIELSMCNTLTRGVNVNDQTKILYCGKFKKFLQCIGHNCKKIECSELQKIVFSIYESRSLIEFVT